MDDLIIDVINSDKDKDLITSVNNGLYKQMQKCKSDGDERKYNEYKDLYLMNYRFLKYLRIFNPCIEK